MTTIPKSLLVVALLGLSCAEPATTSPVRTSHVAQSMSDAALVECPSTTTQSGSGILDALGGVVSVGGVTVVVPAGALTGTTTIDVTVPASKYLEVDISVPGVEHYLFAQPISVRVDYGRCDLASLATKSLSIWYIDSATKQPIELMPTVDDKLTHTATFTTGHLSGYALAD